MKNVDPLSLEYNTCVVCGDVIPDGRQVCPKCVKEHGTDVHVLKVDLRHEPDYDYAYDWFKDGRASDDYDDYLAKEALKELLLDLAEKSKKSREK